ncbi:MAG: hypothetical protein LLG04_07190 [Parachlamydia sp.]|nr:hypothetical protein [Parachlamydia sp.]
MLFICYSICTYGEEAKEPEKPLKIGNLSLPPSQQPGPLVGIGENVIDAGHVQVFLLADQYKRAKGYFIDVVPSVLYGITDKFSVFFNLPVAPRFKEKKQRSEGLEDLFVQLEYAYYTKESLLATDQATVVFSVAFPTGSARKNPPTGFGSPSFLIAATYNHTGIDWFYFGALGAILTTFSSKTKFADLYEYEFGFGRNIASPPGWIYAWMVEINGEYASRNTEDGKINRDSGGNVVYVTPSLWISSENLVVQLGAGGILTQHLYGNQSRFTHQFVLNLGWTF